MECGLQQQPHFSLAFRLNAYLPAGLDRLEDCASAGLLDLVVASVEKHGHLQYSCCNDCMRHWVC